MPARLYLPAQEDIRGLLSADVGKVRVMRISDATDLWLAELARNRRAVRTCEGYRGYLNKLDDQYRRRDVDELTTDDLRRFVDRWATGSAATSAQIVSVLHGFFGWLLAEHYIEVDPSVPLKRPPLESATERDDIVSITSDEVRRMFAVAEDWVDVLTLAVLAYTGVRREAAAQLRWSHYDREAGELTFTEKGRRGGRKITKPVPHELAQVLAEAIDDPELATGANDFVIPSRAALRRTDGTRSAAVVLKTVKRVAKRAGVPEAHVHAFRAAFAVAFLESERAAGRDGLIACQSMLGHKRIETTMVYLRRLDRRQQMETVRTFSWGAGAAKKGGFVLESLLGTLGSTEKEGFEPSTDRLPQSRPERVQLDDDFDLLDSIAGRHVDAPAPAGDELVPAMRRRDLGVE